MPALSAEQRVDVGIRAAQAPMMRQDKIWSRYSDDKIDIAHGLADVIRTLAHHLPIDLPMAALSLRSSSEPQFRILESAFRAGLWLVDVEQAALDVVSERVARQGTGHVRTVRADYRRLLCSDDAARAFVRSRLGGGRVHLVTLRHSLYYAPRAEWMGLLRALYGQVLADGPAARGGPGSPSARERTRGSPCGAIHAVLGSSRSDDSTSAIWLYNHFAGRFFGVRNGQDLADFADELRADERLEGARIETRRSMVRFRSDDFEQVMHVVWMILLHPNVHRFSEDQQREVIEHVYERVYLPGVPPTQVQDHLFVFKPARPGPLNAEISGSSTSRILPGRRMGDRNHRFQPTPPEDRSCAPPPAPHS